MNQIVLKKIRLDLGNKIDPEFQKGAFRFFKEEVKILGVRSSAVKRTASKFWSEIKNQPKIVIFDLCEELWQVGFLFDFVMAQKNKMPRTALRYAIEKLPTKQRKLAMEKQD